MSMYHLGINLGHDRAAALVRDGEVVIAIQQERLDRCKHSVGFMHQAVGDSSQIQIPDEAIRYCLEGCGISWSDVATITANMPGIDHAPDILRRKLSPELTDKVLKIPSHHMGHAYSAYWPSGFEDALILVADATGTTDQDRQAESYTLYTAHGVEIRQLHSEKIPAHLAALSTLGFIYEYVTRKAGFVTRVGANVSVPEAGKLMGLAPYGSYQPNWHRWIHPRVNSYSIKISAYDFFLEMAALEKRYDDGKGKPYLWPYLVDLAWKVQHELEDALLHIVGLAMRETGLRKLCLAGGVALNSVANYKLLTQLGLEDIFIFPAAGDSGIAAGCALWAYATQEKGKQRKLLRKATLGRTYHNELIKQAIAKFSSRIDIEECSAEQAISRTAEALSKGHIVARFEKGSEYGPRALGHRSILADPIFERMKDILNARVKFREAFRPFAPVIPAEDISQVFEQTVSAPFMLLVSQIKEEYHKKIPAVTHYDGTGRVQTVTSEDNPYLHSLCRKLTEVRGGPPVVLNTSFNIAGQPIVETPEEAIETFLNTDMDCLCMENLWISKRNVPVLGYEEHLAKCPDSLLPHGLPSNQPAVTGLMRQLDRALFFGETEGSPWSIEELKALSTEGGRYKETSILFPENPFDRSFVTQLSQDVVLILDPLGKSELIDLSGSVKASSYIFDKLKLLMAVLGGLPDQIEALRIEQICTTLEWKRRCSHVLQLLKEYRLMPEQPLVHLELPDSNMPEKSDRTLSPFDDSAFSARRALASVREVLEKAGYTESAICNLLRVDSLQRIEPTHLYYYDKFLLPQTDLAGLIRLFLLRIALPYDQIRSIFGDTCFAAMAKLGILIQRGDLWASRVDIYCADGLLIATDHRYMIFEEDILDEDPVMYIGLDSMGLVHTAPRYPSSRLLDLCTGSGIQALIGSRYSSHVTGVDLNPRAIRFARFNAQLNEINNVCFVQGDIYSAVPSQKFDIILANPPFVPSPSRNLRFRDGGKRGEEILCRIIEEAAEYLTTSGKLHIVTDLVDVHTYESKLNWWWHGGPAHKLLLLTADRDDILFSVPHSHAPFGQSFESYNNELDEWVSNFRESEMTAVNFGYILIHRLPEDAEGSYYTRTIHNPAVPIYNWVRDYFKQRIRLKHPESSEMFLHVNPDIQFRLEFGAHGVEHRWTLFSLNNPYYTTYAISEDIFHGLKYIIRNRPSLAIFDNMDWVLDLIYKGVLLLSAAQPREVAYEGIEKWNRTLMVSDVHPPKPEDEISRYTIQELETKTTPTCLSSYIGQ